MPKPLPTTPAGDPTTIPELHAKHAAEERELYRAALKAHGWNAAHAAKALGVAHNTAHKAIDRYGLREEYERHSPGRGAPRKAAEP